VWHIVKSRDGNTHRLALTEHPDDNCAKDRKAQVRQFADECFDRFDSNHDGLMSFKDVENMLNHIYKKEHPKGLSKKAVTRLMNSVDQNNDGKVCKGEFYIFCKNKLI
jgi:Ca2+-binding EF-hand superfamily protein